MAMKQGLILSLMTSSGFSVASVGAEVVINEIAYKGSGNSVCDGEDWIELLNTGDNDVDLTGYKLYDDKGRNDEGAETLDDIAMAPGELLVLCREKDFDFGIGEDDTVTLDGTGSNDRISIVLPGDGAEDETQTYSLVNGEYKYTEPTPGKANVVLSPEQKLQAQNDEGNDFFLVNDVQRFGKVVNIDISLDEEGMEILQDHPNWEEYTPFRALSVSNIGDADSGSATVSSKGKIRTKGQWTNSIIPCMGLKSTPFNIKFEEPFMGMENIYLRNHLGDYSYMREHAQHVMLKAFGLPYLRSRPARLFLNGIYVGFYTVMEAPSQGYVMQRSFPGFDPEKTALFKMKSRIQNCPFDPFTMKAAAAFEEPPDPYYFDRGDHRTDTPVLKNLQQCTAEFARHMIKEQTDVARGYLAYDKNCSKAMVELGRVNQDYGPKSMVEPMLHFLDSKFYNRLADNWTDSIDTDQWLMNFAVYAVMLNLDSPVGEINNWYLATVNGGVDDWKIVQWDHNNIAARNSPFLCDESCGPRIVYWPILRPSCGSVEDHMILGQVLNSEENVQKYLDYVQEYVTVLTSGDILEQMYQYGHDIKEYVVEDPLFNAPELLYGQTYGSIEDYVESELGRNTDDWDTEISPFLKTLTVRLEEVQKQLDAIRNGTLPLDEEYDRASICPDWRDHSGSEDYIAPSTMAEDCKIPDCAAAADCYGACSAEGEFLMDECKALSPFCNDCFPYSLCGTGASDPSATFVPSDTCGQDLAGCASASRCFDHKGGMCAFDGTIEVVECQDALLCKPCFPNSRCASVGLVTKAYRQKFEGVGGLRHKRNRK